MSARSDALTLHVATNLGALLGPFGEVVNRPGGDVLAPLWSVTPSTALRQWLDQESAAHDDSETGGVTANLRSFFPEEMISCVEKLALGERWRDWSIETIALRILSSKGTRRFDEARRRAQGIDEIVRWRPHLLEVESRELIPTEIRQAMDALDLFEDGPHTQRARVLEKLSAGELDGLPSRLVVFGLPNVPGGRRFLEFLSALSSSVEVHVFMPVPSTELAAKVLAKADVTDDLVRFSWLRDSVEALQLWSEVDATHDVIEETGDPPTSSDLVALQELIASGRVPSEVAAPDRSVVLMGGFGDARQAEQLRDALFDAISEGVEPHEILVMSPDPESFQTSLERHWNYQLGEEGGGPRLAYELTEFTPERLTNRLGASLGLLRLIGNYADLEQIAELLSYPSVGETLRIDFATQQQILRRAVEGKLIFGVTATQRERFEIYPDSDVGGFVHDIGTWQRVTDRVAVATLYPPSATETGDAGSLEVRPLDALGEPEDLAAFASLQPLLRILEASGPYRSMTGSGTEGVTTTTRTLPEWISELSGWMSQIATQGSRQDDSFERTVNKVGEWVECDEVLRDLALSFEELLELWGSLVQTRTSSRIFGRRGVVVTNLTSFAYAPFKVICVLGLDESKLPTSSLASPIMSASSATDPATGARQPGDPDPRRSVHGALLAAALCATDRLIVSWNSADEETGKQVQPAIALSELLDAYGTLHTTDSEELLRKEYKTTRRHPFFKVHTRPRYDTRLKRIGAEDLTLEPRANLDESAPSTETSITELQRFFRNPVLRYLGQSENIELPSDVAASQIRPALSTDGLVRHAFKERFVERACAIDAFEAIRRDTSDFDSYLKAKEDLARATSPIFESLVHSEELAGDVPASFWVDPEEKERLDLFVFNLSFDLADYETLDPDDVSFEAIDLGDLGRVVLRGSQVEMHEPFEVQMLTGSEGRSREVATLHRRPKGGTTADETRNLVAHLVELLALRINNPLSRCSVVTSFALQKPGLYTKKGSLSPTNFLPSPSFPLNPQFVLSATPEELPADQARAQLATLVSLYHRGLAEALPLFRRTTTALAFGRSFGKPEDLWAPDSERAFGEADETAHKLLFPLSWDELVAETEIHELAGLLRGCGAGVRWQMRKQDKRFASKALAERYPAFAERAEFHAVKVQERLANGERSALEKDGIIPQLLVAEGADEPRDAEEEGS